MIYPRFAALESYRDEYVLPGGLFDDDHLYHVTYGRNFESIQRLGLLPHYNSSFPTVTARKDGVYFTNAPGVAVYYAYFASDPMILRIDRGFFSKDEWSRQVVPDEGGLGRFYPGMMEWIAVAPWLAMEGVPPSEIDVLVDGGTRWAPIRSVSVEAPAVQAERGRFA